MLISSGVRLVLRPRCGSHLMPGSRNHEWMASFGRAARAVSWWRIWASTSLAISCGRERFAVLRLTRPGASQLETSTERMSTTSPLP